MWKKGEKREKQITLKMGKSLLENGEALQCSSHAKLSRERREKSDNDKISKTR